MAEEFGNLAGSVLTSGISDTDTDIYIADDSEFSGEPFRINIGGPNPEELCLVTARPAPGHFVVTRGIEGTTPVAHDPGSSVDQVLTEVGLENFINEKPHTFVGVPTNFREADVSVGTAPVAENASIQSSTKWDYLGVGPASITHPNVSDAWRWDYDQIGSITEDFPDLAIGDVIYLVVGGYLQPQVLVHGTIELFPSAGKSIRFGPDSDIWLDDAETIPLNQEPLPDPDTYRSEPAVWVKHNGGLPHVDPPYFPAWMVKEWDGGFFGARAAGALRAQTIIVPGDNIWGKMWHPNGPRKVLWDDFEVFPTALRVLESGFDTFMSALPADPDYFEAALSVDPGVNYYFAYVPTVQPDVPRSITFSAPNLDAPVDVGIYLGGIMPNGHVETFGFDAQALNGGGTAETLMGFQTFLGIYVLYYGSPPPVPFTPFALQVGIGNLFQLSVNTATDDAWNGDDTMPWIYAPDRFYINDLQITRQVEPDWPWPNQGEDVETGLFVANPQFYTIQPVAWTPDGVIDFSIEWSQVRRKGVQEIP